VHLTEHNLSVRQAQARRNRITPARSGRIVRALSEMPRSRRGVFAALVRAEMTPLMLLPFVFGSLIAWWELGVFDPLVLGFGLIGAVAGAWAFRTLGDYCAHSYDRRPEARSVQDPFITGFGLIRRGRVPATMVRDLGLLLAAICLAATAWLTFLAGWPMLFFAGFSLLIAAAVMLLPFVPGYRGWGIGQVGVMLALGMLPVLTGYYGQAQGLSWLALWASVPVAFIIGLAEFDYDAIHMRRDWLIGKPTLPVNLGPVRSRDVGALLTLSVYVAALLVVSLSKLPLLALATLASLPMALGVFQPLQHEQITPDDWVRLYATALNAGLLTGLLFCAALIVDKLL
jgi:1,4-dihydroxy-2-naphthoate octaprenyltransferase